MKPDELTPPPPSSCPHDWPPAGYTKPGSRHRCGHGGCRVLRVRDDAGILTYYGPDNQLLGQEPLPGYVRTWEDWWAPLLGAGAGAGTLDLDLIMRELSDCSTVLDEVLKVYSTLTGDRVTT